MELQEIEIVINKKGQVEVKVHGAKGKKCLDLTRDLEAALGGEVLIREMTPEALDESNSISLDSHLSSGK